MARDFVIGSLASTASSMEDLTPCRHRRAAAQVAKRGVRGGLCDLSALIRDALEELRARSGPAERALFLVRLLPELPCDARGQLAVALANRLRPDELRGIARAGLLALDDACAGVDEAWRPAVRGLLAPALAARARPRVEGGTLVCAEGARAALALRAHGASSEPVVIFIASAADAAVSAEEAADLLAAEARLCDDAGLAHFAALAAAGRLEVVAEASLRPTPSRWRRALIALLRAAMAQRAGDDTPPVRRPAWGTVSP